SISTHDPPTRNASRLTPLQHFDLPTRGRLLIMQSRWSRMSPFTHRLAELDDVPALRALMNAAISELLKPFLNEAEVRASFSVMGLDTQLIRDGTYFCIEGDGVIVGCGGWSRRATLFGGDHSAGRDAALLEPSTEPARVRAMYTHPLYVRRGVGRLILKLCEEAAAKEGF